jgi:hypothetical protein
VEVKAGESMEIEFTSPFPSKPIRVKGLVRHRNGYFYGVEFQTPTFEDEQRVELLRQTLRVMGSPQPPLPH